MGIVDEMAVRKIMSIQADADKTKVMEEAGEASRELSDAMAELGRLDTEVKEAKVNAQALIGVAKGCLEKAGRSREEIEDMIQVCPIPCKR
jgi:chemotaxis regulatin CheY-phosphate phosphatase CheZ